MVRKRIFKATLLALFTLLLFNLSPGLVAADDPVLPLPHAFYGNLLINGNPAPAGTKVEAIGIGVITASLNPLFTSVEGQYGTAESTGDKLVVQGSTLVDGTIITFYVNDVSTGQTTAWHSGEITQFDLAVTIPPPTPGSVDIPFCMGWNTFSTPIYLHESTDTWGEFIAANDLTILMIYGYDVDEDAWVTVMDDREIKPLWGFYVKVAEAGEAHIISDSEATPLPVRNLAAGVNLIGIAPASLGDELLTTALFTAYWAQNGFIGYELVVSPDINPDSWAYTRDVGDSPMMSSGRAYWLVMGNATKYVGSSTTPVP